MNTEILTIDPKNLDLAKIMHAAHVLRKGGIVAFPTETVYGLAVDMCNEEAVKRLYEIKKRPSDKPSSIHIADKEAVHSFCARIPTLAYKLMYFFWPGPLTIVLPTDTGVSLGFRCPRHAIAHALLYEAKIPVIAPSANSAGQPPPTSAQEVIRDFNGLVEIIIEGGSTQCAEASTVVEIVNSKMHVLRQGALPLEMIEKVLAKKILLFVCTGNTCRSVMAQALFNNLVSSEKTWQAISCGTTAGEGRMPAAAAVQVLAEQKIDIQAHRTQQLTPELIEMADLILVMESHHKQAVCALVPQSERKTFLLKEYKTQEILSPVSISDPIGQSLDTYRRCRDELALEIQRILGVVS